MPNVFVSRSRTEQAEMNVDAAPAVVAVFLSILFALAIWAALAPQPLSSDVATAAIQGGL